MTLRMVAATEMTADPFLSFDFDGVLGLGLAALSQTPEFNVFSRMAAAGAVSESMFAVFLATGKGEESEITFGGFNGEHAADPMVWAPVTMPTLGYWQVQLKEIRANGKPLAFCEKGDCRAVVDTGTSLLAVPSAVLGDLQMALQHPATQPDCMSDNGPHLEIDIAAEEGFVMTLTPRDYARPAEQDYNKTGAGDAAKNGTICEAMLMSLDLPEPLGPKLFILGEPVLRKYYTAYDVKREHVGFARAVHHDETEEDAENDEDEQDPMFAELDSEPVEKATEPWIKPSTVAGGVSA